MCHRVKQMCLCELCDIKVRLNTLSLPGCPQDLFQLSKMKTDRFKYSLIPLSHVFYPCILFCILVFTLISAVNK